VPRYLEQAPTAGYIAVVKTRWKCIGGEGDENSATYRYGIYNTKGVATSQAKKVAGRNKRPGVTVEWWVMEAETTWVRVNP
jgi:hypothetical protein